MKLRIANCELRIPPTRRTGGDSSFEIRNSKLPLVELTGGDGRLFQPPKSAAEQAAELEVKLKKIMAEHFNGKGALDIAKLHKEIKDLKGNLKLAEGVTEATKWDMVVEAWRAGLLSGPVTHTTNLFGTEAFHAMQPAIDVLASIIGMARGASPGRSSRTEDAATRCRPRDNCVTT